MADFLSGRRAGGPRGTRSACRCPWWPRTPPRSPANPRIGKRIWGPRSELAVGSTVGWQRARASSHRDVLLCAVAHSSKAARAPLTGSFGAPRVYSVPRPAYAATERHGFEKEESGGAATDRVLVHSEDRGVGHLADFETHVTWVRGRRETLSRDCCQMCTRYTASR